MRASRLVQLVLLLQTRGRTTAEELAGALEVSVRTVYRDVEALSAAGIPVFATGGHGGGVQLVDGYQTRLTGLSGPEAAALGFAGVPAAAAQLGLEAVLAAAQAKLDAALPTGLRDEARRVRQRFLLDLPGWFDAGDPPPALEPLAAVVLADRRVEIEYGEDRPVTRRVAPLGLVCKGGRWYLLADADGRGAIRTYRVDRVRRVEPLGDTFERGDVDLPALWGRAQASFARDLQRIQVRARLPAAALGRLRRVLVEPNASDAVASAGPPDAEGWVEVRIPAESVEVAHDELLRLADVLEVLDPPELRARLAATGRALAARHDGAVSPAAPTGHRRRAAARR